MNTDTIDSLWAVISDDKTLEVIELKTLVSISRKAFTSPKPIELCIPILSIWDTKEEADRDREALRGFESLLRA